ncbi:hypothetical protein [Carboxylicivirga sp. N1Y90]|uniref:hypothetical protein n=1 Tax=Carboxylicivirga fragile TaxID=3417571 RepID=UPI003D3319F1|nr:hypothetical protein [Marinilabiliaceae bacterium N1Y90]
MESLRKNLIGLLLLAFVLPMSILAQEKVEIHPLLGDSITYEEAYKYYLFRDIGKLDFDYAQVYKKSDVYSLHFYGDSAFSIPMDSMQLKQYVANVELINQYELSASQTNDINVKSDSLIVKSIDLHLMNDEQKKKMIKDARLYQMKKLNADEQGLHGTQREDYINYTGGAVWSPKKKK